MDLRALLTIIPAQAIGGLLTIILVPMSLERINFYEANDSQIHARNCMLHLRLACMSSGPQPTQHYLTTSPRLLNARVCVEGGFESTGINR